MTISRGPSPDARKLQASGGSAELTVVLAESQTPDEQRVTLEAFVRDKGRTAQQSRARRDKKPIFKSGDARVTANRGECRIVVEVDFTGVPRERLEAAVYTFESVMKDRRYGRGLGQRNRGVTHGLPLYLIV